VTLTYRADSAATAERVWELLARPERWSEWAPHVRGARGLGSPEIEPGARGAVLLLGALPVPARITGKRRGRSWSWQVGPVEIEHRVEPRAGGCSVIVELRAPAPVALPLRVTYGPLVAALVRNLARVASDSRPRS
jgi:hypothetical protein